MNDQTSPSARDRILAAARQEFARHGYDGASVRSITRNAGVNLGAITYHFESKQLLYTAVLQALVGPVADRVRFAATADLPPLERVILMVRAAFIHIRTHPEMPAIMMREMASGNEIAEPVKKVLGTALPLMAATIAEGQRDGAIRDGEPILMALSCVSQPVYLNLARRAIAMVGVNVDDDRVLEHVAATVRASLERRP